MKKLKFLFIGKDAILYKSLTKAIRKCLSVGSFEIKKISSFSKAMVTISEERVDIVIYQMSFMIQSKYKAFKEFVFDRKTIVQILIKDIEETIEGLFEPEFFDAIIDPKIISDDKVFYKIINNAGNKCQLFNEYYLSESRFVQLLNDIYDLVYQIDAKGRIIYVNKTGILNLGYSVSDVFKSAFLELIEFEYRKNFLESLEGLIKNSVPVMNLELKMVHKEGKEKFMVHNIYIVRDDKGIPVLIHGLGRDITATRKHREELLERNREVEHFLRAVVHDIRNPLTSILGFLTIIQNQNITLFDEKTHNYILRIQNNAERIESLLNDLSKLSEGESAVFNNVNLIFEHVLLEVIGSLREKIHSDNARINITGGEIGFCMDRNRLFQIFDNLIGNALKYRNYERNLEIEIWCVDNENDVEMGIKDNGIGIFCDEVDKIFSPFYRGKNTISKTKGSGIGLAIVRTIVEHYNGKIFVNSDLEWGTEFKMIFPKRFLTEKEE